MINVTFISSGFFIEKQAKFCLYLLRMKRTILILLLGWFLKAEAQVPRPSTGRLEKIANFPSKFVEARDIDVWLPDDYTAAKRYAVLYVHDGQNLFDTSNTYNREEWKLDEAVGSLLKNGTIKETIVVGIYNSDKRWLEFVPNRPYRSMPPAIRDSMMKNMRITEKSLLSDKYLKFLVKELKPYIDSVYSTYPDVNNTFTMGSSIGGLIAYYAVCEYPLIFGGAACLSTHWPGGQMTNRIDNKQYALMTLKYLQAKAPAPINHRFYFDHGTINLDMNYDPYQKAVDSVLKKKGYNSSNLLSLTFYGADHTEKEWSKRLGGPLFFLLKR